MADKPPLPLISKKNDTNGGYQKHIKSIVYPANQENNHFVKFYINVDQESRIVREEKVKIIGNVDNTDQNRANRGAGSQTRFDTSISALGAAGGGIGGNKIGRAFQDPKTGVGKSLGFLGKTSKLGNIIGKRGGVISAIVGAIAGATVGALSASEFNVTKKLKQLEATISLYMPANIQSTYRMQWSETDSVLVDLLQTDRGAGLFSNLTKSNTKDESGIAGKDKVARIIGTAASPNVIGLVTRTAKNPKKDFLFREVDHRTFVFDYQFSPKSAEEAIDVADIIYMFKFFGHPELIKDFGDFLYLYPAEFDIEYGIQDNSIENADGSIKTGSNQFLNKISSCVLESITVNYASNGSFQSLKNGEPVQTNMSLVFREIEQLTQGRIEQGY